MRCAESYSFDGVIFSNPNPFSFESVAKIFREDPLHYTAPPLFPVDRRLEETLIMSPKQIAEYVSQSFSSVMPDAWHYLWMRENTDVYGNTGRPYKLPWVQLTERTIEQGNLRTRFKDIFYRPKDVSGIQSKGEAILRLLETYNVVTHYDNNPWIIFGLARAIPEAKFVLVQSQNTGTLYSQDQANEFGNVRVEWRLEYTENDHEHRPKPKRNRRKFRSYFEEQQRQRRTQKNGRV